MSLKPKGRAELWKLRNCRHYYSPLTDDFHGRDIPTDDKNSALFMKIELNGYLLPLQYLWDLLRIFHDRKVRVGHRIPRRL